MGYAAWPRDVSASGRKVAQKPGVSVSQANAETDFAIQSQEIRRGAS